MKLKIAISALAMFALAGGSAVAAPKNKTQERVSAGSVAGGAAQADRNGASAGGLAASGTAQERRTERRQARNGDQDTRCLPGTASTSTTGAVSTTRRSGSAAINTNGTASGSGTVRSSSEGDVYSSTTRSGSDADAYGNSSAVAREPTRRC